ncbi:hypothetical protein FRX31_002134 [Thalictrum thalictroides]|uniref:Uncharacterized protein n=1 Tax=Thalictrum thalictroides TaxID=46969 RepID=A0A7J6XFG0_THATH|nr:hypothetical protein FRX31_002134 [Thalictrum thalictroides]
MKMLAASHRQAHRDSDEGRIRTDRNAWQTQGTLVMENYLLMADENKLLSHLSSYHDYNKNVTENFTNSSAN